MKIRMFIGLQFLVVAGCLALRAADNPAQAAARLALEEKLQELETPPVHPPAAARPETVVPPESVVRPEVVAPPAAPVAINLTNPVPATTVVPPVAPPAVAIKIAPAVAVAPASPPPITTPPARKPAMATVVFEKPTDSIVTIYGTVYKNAEVEKVESDGVLISYWTDDGGFAITKLDFKMLSPELQKQYHK